MSAPRIVAFPCVLQWTYGEDRCNGNLISGNTIATYGNECVEMKEGSSGNIVENNVCSNQRDVNSGCFCSRGDSNTFRYSLLTLSTRASVFQTSSEGSKCLDGTSQRGLCASATLCLNPAVVSDDRNLPKQTRSLDVKHFVLSSSLLPTSAYSGYRRLET